MGDYGSIVKLVKSKTFNKAPNSDKEFDIEEGVWYPAKIAGVKERRNEKYKNTDGTPSINLLWIIKLTGEEFKSGDDSMTVFHRTSVNFSPDNGKSKNKLPLYEFYTKALGISDLITVDVFDPDLIIDKPVEIMITKTPGLAKDGTEKKFINLVFIRPLKKQAAGKKTVKPEPEYIGENEGNEEEVAKPVKKPGTNKPEVKKVETPEDIEHEVDDVPEMDENMFKDAV
jgi:hypothetical protein